MLTDFGFEYLKMRHNHQESIRANPKKFRSSIRPLLGYMKLTKEPPL